MPYVRWSELDIDPEWLELISSIGMSASKAIRDAVQGVVAQLRLVP